MMNSMDFFAGAVGLSQFRISTGGVGEIVAGFVCATRGVQAKLGFPFRLKPYMPGDKTLSLYPEMATGYCRRDR